MATFVSRPMRWRWPVGVWSVTHLVTDVVWERTSKFVRCGLRIPAGAETVYLDDVPLTCPRCVELAKRDAKRAA